MSVIPEGGFNVIVVDCPWKYDNWKQKAHGAARGHYAGMPFEDLSAIRVDDWAAKDAVLLQWGTWPKLRQAAGLMSMWGFDYVTGFPWVKVVPTSGEIRRGVGFWTMGASEFVLVGKRGNLKLGRERTPPIGLLNGAERQFYAPIGKHSEKPEGIQEYVEARFPGPYLELFATRERPGWTCLGHGTGWHIHPGRGPMPLDAAKDLGLVEYEEPPYERQKPSGYHFIVRSDAMKAAMEGF